MSFGLPPAGSTPAEEWGNKLLQAVDGALDQAGATASTGGFVDAAPRDQDSTSHDVQQPNLPRLTGGLASSVNVQSIANEAKLAKHSEGLTKEELLKGLSGREQAAAQLAAAQLAIANSAPLSHEMPTGKTSSGPVDATRQISGNDAIQPSPVEATRQIPNDIGVQSSSFVPTSAGQTRDSVQHHQGNLGPSFIAQTVDERLAASQPLQGKDVLLVMQPQEPVPRDVVPSITSNSLATGSQNIHSQQAVPSQFQSSVSVPKQEPLQPKLPDLMPSRNIPVDTPMVEGLPGGWIGSLKTSVPGADRDHPETTVYQDVVTGLDTVGQTAFNAIPQSLKDSINPNRPHPGPSILDQARSALEQVHLPELPNVHLPQLPNVHLPQLPDVRLPQMPDLKGLSSADNRSRAVAGDLPNSSKPDATRSAPVAQPDSADLVDQARNMASDLLSGTRSRAEDAYHAAQTYADKAIGSIKQKDETSRTAPRATPSTTLPLEEKEVQRPGDHTAGVGALPGTIDEAGVAVLPLEKNPGQGSTDKAVAAKEPGPEQSATDGVLDVSGGGQSISAAKADRVDDGSGTTHGSQPNAQLDAIVSDREVRKDTVEPGQNVGQTERLSTLQRESDRSPTDQREVETGPLKTTVDDMAVEKETYQDKQGPIGAFGEETAQGGQREPIDSYEKKTVQEDKRDPVESSFSGLNITTGASAPSSAASAPSGGFALAPPLGVFTETTPVASGASVILPGTVLPPAKREPPVEILPVQESQIPEPMLGRPAADPSIAFEDVTPRGNLELHNETLEATPAIATRERRMDAPEAVLGDSAFGSSAAAPEAQEKDHDVPSYLSSRATSTHESIPSGKLDQPSAARMDSSASVTAVKHGHLGDHHHRDVETPRTTLDTVSEKALPATPLQDERRVVRDADNVRTSPAVTPTPSTPSNVHKPVQVGSNSSNPVNTSASQHQRTDSAVSSSSKKKGFFSKLKDKLHHDDK